jgi:hypothetical protein
MERRHGLRTDHDSALLGSEKYRRLCTRHGALREEIAELNRKLNNDSEHRKQLQRLGDWDRWKQETTTHRDQLVNEYNAISDLLTADMRVRQARANVRRELADSNDMARAAIKAKEIIETLYKQLGDSPPQEYRDLCVELKVLARDVLPFVIRPEASDRMREQQASELQAVRRESDRTIAMLQHQIRNLQKERGAARQILDRLYQGRYEEIDTFRTARGITHRIHLSAANCMEIERAIIGVEEPAE